MSKEQAKEFFYEVAKNKELAEKVNQLMDSAANKEAIAEKLISVAKEHGFNFTKEEAGLAQSDFKIPLSEDELADVSGGLFGTAAAALALVLSVFAGVRYLANGGQPDLSAQYQMEGVQKETNDDVDAETSPDEAAREDDIPDVDKGKNNEELISGRVEDKYGYKFNFTFDKKTETLTLSAADAILPYITDDGSGRVMKLLQQEGYFVIPPFLEDEEAAYRGEVKHIRLDGTVVGVSDDTFANWSYLETVTFSGPAIIRATAFCNCSNLRTVTFDGLENLNDSSKLKIEGEAFSKCESLETVTFNGLKNLDATVNSSRTDLSLAQRARFVIESSAFNDCRKLKTVTFTDVESFGFEVYAPKSAFPNWKSLSKDTQKILWSKVAASSQATNNKQTGHVV